MRPIWSGSISFSLVNIPVKLYSATAGEKISFDLLHDKDLSPIRYAKVCRREEKEVSYRDVVKGYQYKKGSYVVMGDEDFKKANARKTSTIEIASFIDGEEVDSVYYEKPYYLAPDGDGKAYGLFREALKEAGKVALARYVLRNKEKLAVLKPEDNVIVLDQMRYQDDLRSSSELDLPAADFDRSELDLALTLIDRMVGRFDPSAYRDTYRHDLRQRIEEKIEGKTPAVKGEAPPPTAVGDIVSALRESLDREQANP